MDDVIALMYVCEAFAKDVHYMESGWGFYGQHLMADKVNFGDDRDDLIEALMGCDKGYAGTTKHLSRAVELMNAQESNELLHRLADALNSLVYAVEEAKRVERPLAGIHAILDGISQKALIARGLVLKTIAES